MILPFADKNLIGKVLKGEKGDYKITQKLGYGGFDKTYLAEEVDNPNQKWVIKQGKPKPSVENNNKLSFFLNEEESKKEFYLVKEYLDDHDLGDKLPPPNEQLQQSENNQAVFLKSVLVVAGVLTSVAVIGIIWIRFKEIIPPPCCIEELTETYSHPEPDMKFTIKYSDKWIAKPETSASSEKIKFTRKDKLQTDNCPVEILVSVDDLGKALTIEEHKKDVLKNIQNDDTNTLERADETVKLDGTDAYQIRWNRQENGCTFKKLERGTMALKKAYYITYQAPVDENDKFWPVVEKMIDSFDIQEGN